MKVMLISQEIKPFFRNILHSLFLKSLQDACVEQGLKGLADNLAKIVPDLTEQYSKYKVDSSFLKTKVRNMHAFQVSLVNEVVNDFAAPVIVDIGDSAGTHARYLTQLHCQESLNYISVNIDEEAVEKIKRRGFKAIQARAQDLDKYDVGADIFICFEVLEHLMDPLGFLRGLYLKSKAKYLVITVPYIRSSRVGLRHIRTKSTEIANAENTHIFELSPEDWKLILKHSGWSVIKEKIYLQYPRRRFLRFTKPLWKRFDFEGFYGLILKKDDYWTSKYKDW